MMRWFAFPETNARANEGKEASVTSSDADLTFDLTNNQPWPVGKYKVDLYINDKFNRSLEYQVK